MKYAFETIAEKNDASGMRSQVDSSKNWLAEGIKEAQGRKKANSGDRLTSRMNIYSVGRMYLFTYDPKTKDKLPYYDTYPLIFPLAIYKDGFLGMNLHYITPLARAKLMNELYKTTNNKKMDDTTRLRINYAYLNAASQFRYFKPCVKRYLFKHVRSRYLYVPPDEWDKAIMLPTESFVGANRSKVWTDSSNMIFLG